MTAVILHLSDIHIDKISDPILARSKMIASCIYRFLTSASHVFIIVSGDVAFSGEDNQYILAKKFLDKIKSIIQEEKFIPVSFIIVPGNHDCDFKLDTGTRKVLVNSITGQDSPPDIDDSIIDSCTAIQKSFFDFRKKIENNEAVIDDNDKLWRSSHFSINGKTIGFESLNISWVSNLQEKEGHLFFPIDRYTGKEEKSYDLRLLIIHHPLNWFGQRIYHKFKLFIRRLADIVISGHEHQGTVGINDDAETDKSGYIEGCVLQDENDPFNSSFNIAEIDLDKRQLKSIRYTWNGTQYITTDNGSWLDYHNLPIKKKKFFNISETFKEKLNDPGVFLKHPGKEKLILSDIFIYPDLMKVHNKGDKLRHLINSKILQSPDETSKGVLIESDEKAGVTSLIYQLYYHYYDKDFVPLYLNGKNLKNSNEDKVNSLIKREFSNQYSKNDFQQYEQLPKKKKILLLDDFDDGPIKNIDARMDILSVLREKFGYLVVTVKDMFQMREILDRKAPCDFILLNHYKLQSFGYGRRSELIERWFSMGNDGTLSDAEFLAQCDQAERMMNSVMVKMVIPSIPLYLLILLQSMEAGNSGGLKESGLGHYYNYLLTQAFNDSGVKPDKLTEVFQYAAHLAAKFHYKQKNALSEDELKEFNNDFSQKWHTVDLRSRLDLLIRSRILYQIGDGYAFRYPYVYYYLKGLYLSKKN